MTNGADIAWVLVASALVLFMTPGLALFYGGLVRNKNVITTMYQVIAVALIISIQWILFGYSLAFGPDVMHLIGNFHFALFYHVGFAPDPAYASTIPAELFAIFQMMFAIITPAVIVGGLAERVKFSSFLVFSLLWSTLIYDPLTHWVWGQGGWLHQMHLLDFAGGTVVEMASGISGLVCAMYLGKRHGHGTGAIKAHNVPLVIIGTAILWFGWFGFNAGSALAANDVAVNAFLVTNTAAAASGIAWVLIERWQTGHASIIGAAAGIVSGLVAITPASGFINPGASIVLGLIAGVISYFFSTMFKNYFGYDDALDAFGAHGIGGTWGMVATGLFATIAVNPQGLNGLFFGNSQTLWVELLAIVVTWVFCGAGTWVLLKVVDLIMGIRVTPEEEKIGLDVIMHNENAYPENLTFDVAANLFESLKKKSQELMKKDWLPDADPPKIDQ